MCKATTQIIELRDNSIPPPCPIHGMWGGRMTSCVAVPTNKHQNYLPTYLGIPIL